MLQLRANHLRKDDESVVGLVLQEVHHSVLGMQSQRMIGKTLLCLRVVANLIRQVYQCLTWHKEGLYDPFAYSIFCHRKQENAFMLKTRLVPTTSYVLYKCAETICYQRQ